MNNTTNGFTSKYHTYKLVHYEETSSVEAAIHREKCLKRWKRAWKIRLIEESNPEWKNLYHKIKEQ
jgi:putative endonuclease